MATPGHDLPRDGVGDGVDGDLGVGLDAGLGGDLGVGLGADLGADLRGDAGPAAVPAALAIRRYDPEVGPEASWQRYEIEMPAGSTVLEALMYVQEHVDGSLAFRRSCRHAICGSCGMRINGCARLACNTQLSTAVAEAQRRAARRETAPGGCGDDDPALAGAAVRIEPLGNMPVIKDLVTDMTAFWQKLRSVQPWLQSLDERGDTDRERLMLPEQYAVLAQGLLCVECGACYSDCIALEAEPEFIGPTSLVKAYRYSYDIRDEQTHRRLFDLTGEHGLWECTRCYMCTQRCPKHLRVRELIGRLAELAQVEGLCSDAAVKRAQAFVKGIEESGRVDERTLAREAGGGSWPAEVSAAARAAAGALTGERDREPVSDVELVSRVSARLRDGSPPGGSRPGVARRGGS